MVVEFISELKFSCQNKDGKPIKIDNILKRSRFVFKYDDYIAGIW